MVPIQNKEQTVKTKTNFFLIYLNCNKTTVLTNMKNTNKKKIQIKIKQQIKAVCFTVITCALKYGFLKNVLLVNASR